MNFSVTAPFVSSDTMIVQSFVCFEFDGSLWERGFSGPATTPWSSVEACQGCVLFV